MIGPTPLFDCFRRGEVARDVRLLAAEGALAPRAYEQLAILVHLLEDPDAEIRRVSNETLDRIPVEALRAFLAHPDVPVAMREFFGDRGVFPAEIPAIQVDEPLIAADNALEGDAGADSASESGHESTAQRLAMMAFPDQLKEAFRGTRETRAILIRSPNRILSATVLSSPKVTESEIEAFARMTNVSEDVLRTIGSNRAWTKNYGVVVGLTKNPKTPLAMSLNMMSRLNDRDLAMLAVDRNVPEPLRIAARKRNSGGPARG